MQLLTRNYRSRITLRVLFDLVPPWGIENRNKMLTDFSIREIFTIFAIRFAIVVVWIVFSGIVMLSIGVFVSLFESSPLLATIVLVSVTILVSTVRANLRRAFLRDTNLQRAFLRGANLQRAFLRDANLQGAFLWGANLQGADLRYAKLQGAILWGANLQGADLRYANLREADLQGAKLRFANLQEANLHGANLRRADLRFANLRRADLRHANLQGAVVADYKGILGGRILTHLDENTILPDRTKYNPAQGLEQLERFGVTVAKSEKEYIAWRREHRNKDN